MAYLTDRKRAAGLGASGGGTEHHWNTTVSSYALLILVPLFVVVMGIGLGLPYIEARIYFGRPFPAIVAGLTLVVGLVHFRQGFQVLVEDYARGHARQLLVIGGACLSYALIGAALWAIVRLALI